MTKPCEMPCEKCGHGDVMRRFRAEASTWPVEEYGKACNRFASANAYLAKAHRDHIDHTCRCCQYRWQTLPMAKPRKKRLTANEVADG